MPARYCARAGCERNRKQAARMAVPKHRRLTFICPSIFELRSFGCLTVWSGVKHASETVGLRAGCLWLGGKLVLSGRAARPVRSGFEIARSNVCEKNGDCGESHQPHNKSAGRTSREKNRRETLPKVTPPAALQKIWSVAGASCESGGIKRSLRKCFTKTIY